MRDSLNLYNLHAACQARHDAHARARYAGPLGEEADAFVVGLAIHRRGCERELPRIAEALQLNAKELCAKALLEFHPLVYAALFGHAAAPVNVQQVQV